MVIIMVLVWWVIFCNLLMEKLVGFEVGILLVVWLVLLLIIINFCVEVFLFGIKILILCCQVVGVINFFGDYC